MGKTRLTKRVIDALPLPSSKSGKRYYDAEHACFGLTVYPSGHKTFFIEYGPRGKQRRMSIGRYGPLTLQDAREKAQKELARVLEGQDPLEKKKAAQERLTLGEWVDQYLEDVRARKKHPREDVRYLSEAKERWGTRPLEEISAEDLQKVFATYVADGRKTTANRWLASIRACLQAAWRLDMVPSNPAMKIRSMPAGQPRTRVLADDELKKLLEEVDKLEDVHAEAAITLLVETGARQSEVLRARWEDFDLAAGFWRIPSTKAGRPQIMPLASATVAMLKNLPRAADYVVAGRFPDKPRIDLKRPWEKLKVNAEIPDVHLHDIRRTFGLHVTRRAGLHIASKLLRHSDIRVTERHYAPLGVEELRSALQQREADVIKIRAAHEEVESNEN